MKLRRPLLAAASGLVLLAASGLPGLASAHQSASISDASSVDGAGPLQADPSVRYGVLSNGMRYAILRNASPPQQAAFRFRIDAGSLAERDDQRGLAHFVEHMAFNGSANIPEGEMTRRLERLGLAFGSDSNAMTTFDQTVYMLNLPNTSDAVVTESLKSLREIGGELLMDGEAIDRERGVIVGEARTRDTPAQRSLAALVGLVAPGQRLADRMPIGDLNLIRSLPREEFVAFYQAYYRPERATLVAVGDFDVDRLEAQIRSAFGDWRNTYPNGPDPDLGQVRTRSAETHIVLEPGVQANAQIFWTRDFDDEADSAARREREVLRTLGLAVLNRRLAEIARADDPPFLGGVALHQPLVRSVDTTSVVVAFNPEDWRRAIETAEREQRRLVQFGVTEAELTLEASAMRAALEAAAAGAGTRETPALASALLDSLGQDRVFTSPGQDLILFDRARASATPEAVTRVLQTTFEGQGPLALITTPVAIEGGEPAVTAALEASRAVAVEAPAAVGALSWPYGAFGQPGAAAETIEAPDLGGSFVTFENGVKLTVRPTTFTDDQILVSVRVGQGDLSLDPTRPSPAWAAGAGVIDGGLGQLTRSQLEQVIAGHVVGASFSIDADAFTFAGATRPEDLALQMQLLAAYLTDPGWKAAPFLQAKGLYGRQLDQAKATPAGAFAILASGLLASGDRRFGYPTAEEVAASEFDALKALVQTGLSKGPVEVVIVGDVTVRDAIAATAATFGALAPRPLGTPHSETSSRVVFPASATAPVALHHTGPSAQALGYVGWPTVDSIGDRKAARIANALSRVLQLRLTDELRERQGVAYAPASAARSSTVFPGYGYLFTQVEVPPEALPDFFDTVDALTADLQGHPVSDDELKRALLPLIEQTRRDQATNLYWLGALAGVQDNAARRDAVRTAVTDLEAITPQDIQRAAQAYLRPERAWRAKVTAEAVDAGE